MDLSATGQRILPASVEKRGIDRIEPYIPSNNDESEKEPTLEQYFQDEQVRSDMSSSARPHTYGYGGSRGSTRGTAASITAQFSSDLKVIGQPSIKSSKTQQSNRKRYKNTTPRERRNLSQTAVPGSRSARVAGASSGPRGHTASGLKTDSIPNGFFNATKPKTALDLQSDHHPHGPHRASYPPNPPSSQQKQKNASSSARRSTRSSTRPKTTQESLSIAADKYRQPQFASSYQTSPYMAAGPGTTPRGYRGGGAGKGGGGNMPPRWSLLSGHVNLNDTAFRGKTTSSLPLTSSDYYYERMLRGEAEIDSKALIKELLHLRGLLLKSQASEHRLKEQNMRLEKTKYNNSKYLLEQYSLQRQHNAHIIANDTPDTSSLFPANFPVSSNNYTLALSKSSSTASGLSKHNPNNPNMIGLNFSQPTSPSINNNTGINSGSGGGVGDSYNDVKNILEDSESHLSQLSNKTHQNNPNNPGGSTSTSSSVCCLRCDRYKVKLALFEEEKTQIISHTKSLFHQIEEQKYKIRRLNLLIKNGGVGQDTGTGSAAENNANSPQSGHQHNIMRATNSDITEAGDAQRRYEQKRLEKWKKREASFRAREQELMSRVAMLEDDATKDKAKLFADLHKAEDASRALEGVHREQRRQDLEAQNAIIRERDFFKEQLTRVQETVDENPLLQLRLTKMEVEVQSVNRQLDAAYATNKNLRNSHRDSNMETDVKLHQQSETIAMLKNKIKRMELLDERKLSLGPELKRQKAKSRWYRGFMKAYRMLYRKERARSRAHYRQQLQLIVTLFKPNTDPTELLRRGTIVETLALTTCGDDTIRKHAVRALRTFIEKNFGTLNRSLAGALSALDLLLKWTQRARDMPLSPESRLEAEVLTQEAKSDFHSFIPLLGVLVTSQTITEVATVVIVRVLRFSAASTAGVCAGDHLQAINGRVVRSLADFRRQVMCHVPGDEISLRIWRSGELLVCNTFMGAKGRSMDQVLKIRRLKKGIVYSADIMVHRQASEERAAAAQHYAMQHNHQHLHHGHVPPAKGYDVLIIGADNTTGRFNKSISTSSPSEVSRGERTQIMSISEHGEHKDSGAEGFIPAAWRSFLQTFLQAGGAHVCKPAQARRAPDPTAWLKSVRDDARVLLFVVDHSASLEVMFEAAEEIGRGRQVVLIMLKAHASDRGDYSELIKFIKEDWEKPSKNYKAIVSKSTSLKRRMTLRMTLKKQEQGGGRNQMDAIMAARRQNELSSPDTNSRTEEEVQVLNQTRERLRELCKRTGTPVYSSEPIAFRDAVNEVLCVLKGAVTGESESGAEVF